MVHPDLEKILNHLVPFAQEMLAKHGEFFPFGSAINTQDQLEAHAAFPGEEQPPSERMLELLKQGFREPAAAGKIKAAGICYDVRVTLPGSEEKTDAIAVAVEHQNGESLTAYIPYKKGWFGRINYGKLFATKKEPEIFGERGSHERNQPTG